ncbi:AraC family transcriptional regulator [Dyadobacter sp. 22481]|uniref:AraC family transcriptional regulator n=1 Tax=Dyadobacter sp. 22481 TaxID=3453926 RepID=UPI003F8767A6
MRALRLSPLTSSQINPSRGYRRIAAAIILHRLGYQGIALNLGFEDQKYFSRLFKKVVGVGPTVFRDKQLSID